MSWTDCTHNTHFELTLQKGVMESQKGTVKAEVVEGVELSLKLFPMAQEEQTTLAKYQTERCIGHFPLPLQATPDSKETEPCTQVYSRF